MADRQPDPSRSESGLWQRLVDPALHSQVRRKLLSLSFFINLLGLATPVFVLQTYDRVIMHAGISTLQALVAGVVAASLLALAANLEGVLEFMRANGMGSAGFWEDE